MEKDQSRELQNLETLKMLYPIFKQEVFDRRDRMMRVASMAGGFLLILLGLAHYFEPAWNRPGIGPWPFVLGVFIFTGVIIHHLRQHSRRHGQAKQAVIDIEKAMGLFESGRFFPDRGLYPSHWEIRPPRDYGLYFYAACLIALSILVILPILIIP